MASGPAIEQRGDVAAQQPESAGSVRAVLGLIGSRGIVLVAGLVTGVLTARALGPDGRGQYFAVTTLAAIVAQFGNLGLTSSNVFLAAREHRLVWPLLVNGWWLAGAIATIAAVAVLLVGDPLAAHLQIPQHMLWPVCVLAPATLLFTLSCSVLVAEDKFAALNRWQVVNALLSALLLTVAAVTAQPVEVFVAVTACAAAVTVVAMGWAIAKGRARQWKFDSQLFADGWRFASRAYVVLLLGFLMQRAAVAVLMVYSDTHQIGLYSIASQILDVLIIVPSSVATVLFPRLVRQVDGSWLSVRRALRGTLLAMVIVCGVVAALAVQAIELLFGRAFYPAIPAVRLVLVAALFTTVTTVLSQFVVAQRFPGALIAVWAAGLVTMCAAGALLAGRFGATGIAAAQSIGSAVVCVGVVILALRKAAAVEAKSGAIEHV